MKKEPLKIYADNKESYFQVKYMDITMPGKDVRLWLITQKKCLLNQKQAKAETARIELQGKQALFDEQVPAVG